MKYILVLMFFQIALCGDIVKKNRKILSRKLILNTATTSGLIAGSFVAIPLAVVGGTAGGLFSVTEEYRRHTRTRTPMDWSMVATGAGTFGLGLGSIPILVTCSVTYLVGESVSCVVRPLVGLLPDGKKSPKIFQKGVPLRIVIQSMFRYGNNGIGEFIYFNTSTMHKLIGINKSTQNYLNPMLQKMKEYLGQRNASDVFRTCNFLNLNKHEESILQLGNQELNFEDSYSNVKILEVEISWDKFKQLFNETQLHFPNLRELRISAHVISLNDLVSEIENCCQSDMLAQDKFYKIKLLSILNFEELSEFQKLKLPRNFKIVGGIRLRKLGNFWQDTVQKFKLKNQQVKIYEEILNDSYFNEPDLRNLDF